MELLNALELSRRSQPTCGLRHCPPNETADCVETVFGSSGVVSEVSFRRANAQNCHAARVRVEFMTLCGCIAILAYRLSGRTPPTPRSDIACVAGDDAPSASSEHLASHQISCGFVVLREMHGSGGGYVLELSRYCQYCHTASETQSSHHNSCCMAILHIGLTQGHVRHHSASRHRAMNSRNSAMNPIFFYWLGFGTYPSPLRTERAPSISAMHQEISGSPDGLE